MNQKGISNTAWIAIGIIALIVIGGGYYLYNEEQKSITGQAIADLERQLEEQGKLTNEQERQLEKLAQVKCRDVQVPYEDQEAYTEQEPYSDEVCNNIDLVYKRETGSCRQYVDNLFASDEPAKYDCTISNFDDTAGTFSMEIGFNIDGQRIVETQSKYIYPQSSETFYAQKMAEIESCTCSVTNVPQKQECEIVTKYNIVTKYRTITKYKTETVCE